MPFQYILANLLAENEGALGVLFLDGTGETVDLASAGLSPFEMKVIGAYIGIYLRQLDRYLDEAGIGPAKVLHIERDQFNLFTVPLPDEYFLVLVQRRPALVAKARQTLAAAAEQLTQHLF